MQTPSTTSIVCSNINDDGLAGYLADAKHGSSFSSLIYKSKGKNGKGRNLSCYVILTGFSYENALKKDLKTIVGISKDDLYAACVASNKRDKKGNLPTLEDCENAIKEQTVSLQKSLDNEAKSTTDDVREPMIVEGQRVPGLWVNNGSVDPAKRGDPILYGLCISKKIIELDPNQPTPTKSAGKTVAKNLLKNKFLRIGKFVSFLLTKETEFYLRLGGSAVAQACKHGITEIDGMSVREVYEASQRAA